jgi:hypothetical protein
MFLKLYYWNYSGDRGLQILSLQAASWPALPYMLAQLDTGSVILKVVKRTLVTDPAVLQQRGLLPGPQHLTQMWKNHVDNGDSVEKQSLLCKGCTHDLCKFHYNCNYSF